MLRWLVKADGTRVLQECWGFAGYNPNCTDKEVWKDVREVREEITAESTLDGHKVFFTENAVYKEQAGPSRPASEVCANPNCRTAHGNKSGYCSSCERDRASEASNSDPEPRCEGHSWVEVMDGYKVLGEECSYCGKVKRQ